MSADVDWLAVEMVCQGSVLALRTNEKRMVVRRLADRLLTNDDPVGSSVPPGKLTAQQVADRLRTTERSVQRYQAELPAAHPRECPVCLQQMFVLTTGIVEQHPDRLYEPCPMSGRRVLSGLAAVRPDLYQWAVTA